MKRHILTVFLAVALAAPVAMAQYKDKPATDQPAGTRQTEAKQNDDTGRVSDAAAVIREFAGMTNGAPRALVERATAVVIVPAHIHTGSDAGSASGMAAMHGNGVLSVRNADNTWSEPVFVKFTGGKPGAQTGSPTAPAGDLVLVFTNDRHIATVLDGSLMFGGGNVRAMSGPIGAAGTGADATYNADVYSYSRTVGTFAGAVIEGAQLSVDKDAISRVYGGQLKAHDVVRKQPAPGSPGEELATALKQFTGVQAAPEPTTGSVGSGKSQ